MTPSLDLSRRQFLGAAGLTAGAALLAGCAPAAASATGPRTLQFWHLLSGGDGVTMTGLLDGVNKKQSAYRIRPTVLAWGTPYYTKLAMAAAGGRAPDVAIMHATRVLGWAPGGLLDAWDTGRLADLGVDKSTFPDPIWKKGEALGKRFSVALDAHPFVLMYNTDVCKKAGVLDQHGRLKVATSPDEFLAMVDAIAGVTGGHGLSYGYLGDGAQMWRLFYTLYTQHGIEMEMPQGGTATIDKDAAVASLEFMQKLLNGKRAAKQADYGTAVAEFAGGKSGMFLSGVWELRTMQAAKIPFDVTMIPPLFGTQTAYADSHSFVLPHQTAPDSGQRDLVYRFVADMLKGSYGWAEAGHIPAYLPVTESPKYAKLLPQAHYAEAAKHVRYDPPAWFTGSGSNFQGQFGAAAQPALLSGGSASDAVDRFEQAVKQFLAQPNPADPEGARR
ncbi:extracellular solute-binding protein [Microbacterium sp. 22242]|uniref:extracellular solute-binding protein n=1 Tax=Microbacterium sp. 22242 TaxID=3453896 RepID=UPI003F87BB51